MEETIFNFKVVKKITLSWRQAARSSCNLACAQSQVKGVFEEVCIPAFPVFSAPTAFSQQQAGQAVQAAAAAVADLSPHHRHLFKEFLHIIFTYFQRFNPAESSTAVTDIHTSQIRHPPLLSSLLSILYVRYWYRVCIVAISSWKPNLLSMHLEITKTPCWFS